METKQTKKVSRRKEKLQQNSDKKCSDLATKELGKKSDCRASGKRKEDVLHINFFLIKSQDKEYKKENNS